MTIAIASILVVCILIMILLLSICYSQLKEIENLNSKFLLLQKELYNLQADIDLYKSVQYINQETFQYMLERYKRI